MRKTLLLLCLFNFLSLFLKAQSDTLLVKDTNSENPITIVDSIELYKDSLNIQLLEKDSLIQRTTLLKSFLDDRDTTIAYLEKDIDSLLIKIDSLEKIISFIQTNYGNDTTSLLLEIDELRANEYNLKQINDTLVKYNEEYKLQIIEKTKLLEEKIRIQNEKEILFFEKEQVYKEAINNSNIDKVKIEGLVQSANIKIEGKEKEIDLLQKNINEKENSIAQKDSSILKITNEKEMYYIMADTLRSKLVEAEKRLLQIDEELKYTRRRAEEAEAKIAAATNRKKKVRVIQGIAMRFFPTPDWDIVPRDKGNGNYENIIINRNSSKVEFDFVAGATVMLYDLTKPSSKFASDIAIYVGFGGQNLFKNFYFGASYRFLDFFHLALGVNVAEYTLLAENFNKEGSVLQPGWSIQTTKQWKVTPFISLSLDLDFLTYMGKK
ncbi:MAG: hypothetical protein LBM25_01605 [Bacteroidales bacterium]|jgi:hypothetical protein|nr:hypothetical protein [Bacteroidales bacterium]